MGALLDLTNDHHHVDANQALLEDVINGLSKHHKTLPCKYFYDDQGSKIFERICELDEYYLTRTELGLLNQVKSEIAEQIGPEALVIEPGSGAGQKIRLLLSSLVSPLGYSPVEISKNTLVQSVEDLGAQFPDIDMKPIAGDFAHVFSNPDYFAHEQAQKHVVFFPGSTIGNFESLDARRFLSKLANTVGGGGGLLIGVDLVKDRQVLLDAYNDSQEVTADFNLNILKRLNRELSCDFDIGNFQHQAIYNEELSRIEMHLVSRCKQSVCIEGNEFDFAKGESIHTENSHKYTLTSFKQLAQTAGFTLKKYWTDSNQWFGIFYLEVVEQ
jgi:L-histidine N-alpha-methyltransferase